MLRTGELTGLRILLPKGSKTAKDGTVTDIYQRFGRVHMAVFSPDGMRVVGLMVKRPDIVGMVKREDAFLALDSFARHDEKTLVVTRPKDGLDDAARKRLQLDWDRCLMWSGMDARTVGGASLGYVSDAEFDEKTGRVTRFLTTDGDVSRALVGSFVIEASMVRGYADGCMIVDPGGKEVQLDGGLAAAAGEKYAQAKAGASKLGKKAGAVAGEAVDKGSFELGRAIGKAKRSIQAAAAEGGEPAPAEVPALDVRVERLPEQLPGKTVGPEPASAQPAAPKKKPASSGDKFARAAGRQLGAFGKMFGDFKSEFDKASKG